MCAGDFAKPYKIFLGPNRSLYCTQCKAGVTEFKSLDPCSVNVCRNSGDSMERLQFQRANPAWWMNELMHRRTTLTPGDTATTTSLDAINGGLSTKIRHAFLCAARAEHFLLVGAGGVGKTFAINQLVPCLQTLPRLNRVWMHRSLTSKNTSKS